jgi:hypothetical protein
MPESGFAQKDTARFEAESRNQISISSCCFVRFRVISWII